MPERPFDTNALWKYDCIYPGMDAKVNPIAVESTSHLLVDSVGTDGRFLGSIRPFPGMADVTVHGVPAPSATTTITSLSNVIFAKYVAIQKGISSHTLKGIVYIADNSAGDGKSIYFAYRDSQGSPDPVTDVVELEDTSSWVDYKISNLIDFDVTSLGRYIYFVASADVASTPASVSGKEPPYNKAYYWDFKINTWDTFTASTFRQRFLGLLPERILKVVVNKNRTDTTQSDSTSAYRTVQDATGAYDLPDGNYGFGMKLISRKHNLKSWFRFQTKNPIGTASLRWRIGQTALIQTADRQFENPTGANPSVVAAWGLSHFDGVALYRTPADDLTEPIGASEVVYDPAGQLYLQESYLERLQDGVVFDVSQYDFLHGTDSGNPPPLAPVDHTWMPDTALVQQEAYNPVLDDFSPAPRMRRIVAYDRMLVGVTDMRELATPTREWATNDQLPQSLVWSTLNRFPDEPENFPPSNIYPPEDASEKFLSLEEAGDFLFAVSNGGIYKIARSGAQLALNKLHYRIGGVSRFGQIAVGNSLFVVTRNGLKEVDGNSGEIRSVSALDRIILDNSEWASTLGDVRIGYDAAVGALVLLNTASSKQECIILWEATGAVTRLQNCPWVFLTTGPEVLTDGPHRAYFITATGQVHVIDGARQMGKRTMCGTAASETVNGTFTSGTTSTTLIDSTATFPLNIVGFRVHVTSGTQDGQVATVSSRDSATQLTVTGLGGGPAVGDKYSVSPVVTRLVFPVLSGAGGVNDPFVAKLTSGMSIAFSDLGGETTPSDTNAVVTMGIKREGTTLISSTSVLNVVPDKCVARVNIRDTRPFPFIETLGSNMDYEVQAVKIAGQLTSSEAQSQQT